ncbi:NAD(P)(+) transhydrogenase (Re/Si-specific) subunit beta [Porphyromonadaceae bacterium W3.11]|nr:NAD(P)(+) transhydrogenase (Re/Si-specific) subunit beta [Porphyromonadaceae bacterium W3.11]
MNILIPVLVVLGLWLMSRVPSAVKGNRLSILAMFLAVVFALWAADMVSILVALLFIVIGGLIGLMLAKKVTMIQMPQTVGLLNGLGGGASALVGIVSLMGIMSPEVFAERVAISLFSSHHSGVLLTSFEVATAVLAIMVGMLTLTGSLVAAGKLHKVLPQKPVVYKKHSMMIGILLGLLLAIFVWATWFVTMNTLTGVILSAVIVSALFGWLFAIRVGGADMPITISLLNSLSGVAGSIAGMAIGNIMLVAIGGIVGASGLLLTQIMCKAMNRNLLDILLGKTSAPSSKKDKGTPLSQPTAQKAVEVKQSSLADVMKAAKSVIIVPGYGMALAQAQHQVKQLGDAFEKNGAKVRYAIHPVAGRMPGHMNVLLAEADVDYEELYEMEAINDDFKDTDLVVVIGANDVLNPAARDAEGTPIYGMPVLNVDQAKHVVICNFDLNPGYAGVPNPLYDRANGVTIKLGDAKETVSNLITELQSHKSSSADVTVPVNSLGSTLKSAKSVIIVPGYGMALAQAQHQVKQLGDAFEKNGAKVRYAIHPVAGRMPGHMNVLLAEADVDYEELYEMEAINDDFKDTDLVVVIGANDVLNPAARNAEGTPIYGMPVLNVDQAKHVVICNFDLNPGYAGVPNPLYEKSEGVTLKLGDAKESVSNLISELQNTDTVSSSSNKTNELSATMKAAKSVIIVPGYGMALAQAQHQVKQLGDAFEKNGAKVRYAIHPVAGRMPGHMNVLLAEADVDYEELYEMEAINDDFKDTDLVVVIGANDVLNPAARDAEGTPIYGMPVLNVDQAKHVVICNFDLNPGYAGVPNPLYEKSEGVTLKLGDAKESVAELISDLQSTASDSNNGGQEADLGTVIKSAKSVIIVPGYGMALAQAQHQVKQLGDALEKNGAKVRYAIHPVAGRMPGHMNVLLAEADVDYEELYEMEAINDDFKATDLVVVIGANDVLNPAARDAEGTPIYGMPVLNVDQAKYVIICNYDLNPGYAGVPNPLYERSEGVTLLLGDAKESLDKLLSEVR